MMSAVNGTSAADACCACGGGRVCNEEFPTVDNWVDKCCNEDIEISDAVCHICAEYNCPEVADIPIATYDGTYVRLFTTGETCSSCGYNE
jgi:hypothetical protein